MAGGGVKINNINVVGGANGRTATFKIEGGHLYNSYDNGVNWHDLGQVRGIQGERGEQGERGLQGPRGDIGPKGEQGDRGIQGERGEIGYSFFLYQSIIDPNDRYVYRDSIYPQTASIRAGDILVDQIGRLARIEANTDNLVPIVAIGNIRGPQGETGEKGDTGNTGSKGDMGLSMYYTYDNIYTTTTSLPIANILNYNWVPLKELDLIISENGNVAQVTADATLSDTNVSVVYLFTVKGERGERGEQGLQGSGANPNLLINSNFAINQRDGYYAPVGVTVYDGAFETVLGTVRVDIQTNFYSPTYRSALNIAATLNGQNITIQKGFIKLSDCVSGYVANPNPKIYSFDRWQLTYGKVDALTSGGIKHTSSNTWQGIRQIIENPSSLAGLPVTLTVKGHASENGDFRAYIYYEYEGQTRNIVAFAATTSTVDQTIFASGTIPADITDNDKVYVMLYNSLANATFYCSYAKLEIGNASTLYTPPMLAEEMPKCQRFFQTIMLHGGAITAANKRSFYPMITRAQGMRNRSTFTVIEQPEVRGNGSNNVGEISFIAPYKDESNGIMLQVYMSSDSLTVGQIYVLANGRAEIDSEIY